MSINPITNLEPETNFNSVWGRYNNMYSILESKATTNWPIREGTVLSVNREDYTCTVRSGGSTFSKVRCCAPWFNCTNGKGVTVHPESGSWVLIAKAESSAWFILGFIPMINVVDENYKNSKPDLNEGDIDLSTDTGNFIRITKTDQTIWLFNSPACQVIMTSMNNKISVLTQQLFIENRAGAIWMISDRCEDPVEDPETGELLDRPVDTLTTGFFKMNTADFEHFVKFDIGKVSLSNEVPDNVIAALNICNKLSITVDTDGNVTFYTAGNKTNLTIGNVMEVAKGTMGLKSVGEFNVASDRSVNTSAAGNIVEQAGGEISNNAASVTHGPGSASPNVSATPFPIIKDISSVIKYTPYKINPSLVP